MSRKLLNLVLFVISLGYLALGPYISFLTFDFSLTMIENLTTTEIFPSGTVGGIILAFIGTIISLWIVIISFSILFPSLKVSYLKKRYLEERYVFLIYVSIMVFLIIGASWFLLNRHHMVNTGTRMPLYTIVPPIYMIVIVLVALLVIVLTSRELNISLNTFLKLGSNPNKYSSKRTEEIKTNFLAEEVILDK